MTDDSLWPNVDDYLEIAQKAGVRAIININTDVTTLQRGIELNKKYPFFYNAAATTPHDTEKWGEKDFFIFEKAARNKDLIALELSLPVIIHCRDAFHDLFKIADEEYIDHPLVLHCFTGTKEEIQECAKRGWFVSFSGIVTFKKSIELRETLHFLPLDRLLIETDAPYLAPQSHRGKLNHPAYIVETAEVIAKELSLSLEEVGMIASKNACCCFGLKEVFV
ncbi:MAG: TatD family deoxyribonuclease [Chlamydiae bacterium]|nr:TatD family deoxyribonuclease [Chlamydiota bacterium]